MPIVPLPQFEADAHLKEQSDREAYGALAPPKTIVVRFGAMKMVGEYPYDGTAKPGCGSKLVVRTHRGTELGEMLTSTCPNSGCSKSVSRKEMLEFIDNSGGRDYPFFTDGKILRVATVEDLNRQSQIEQSKHELKVRARSTADRAGFGHIKIVEVEPLLGGERVIVHFLSEERIEFRDLGPTLAREFHGRVDFHPVGARDEARITADYEKCGQYCCCKNFLKVLKPVSMKSAKIQKATLDPLKISGRCGRLMCCLRYEDQTYDELRKRLPHKRTRVGTPEGDGIVIDGQILTQLALIELDALDEMGRPKQVAIPVENLTPPVNATAPVRPQPGEAPARGAGPRRPDSRSPQGQGGPSAGRPPRPAGDSSRPPAPRHPDAQRGGQQQRSTRPPEPPRAPRPPNQGAQQRPAQPNQPRDQQPPLDFDDIPTDDGTLDDGPRGPRRGRRRRRRGGGSGGAPGGPSGGSPRNGPPGPPNNA
ncbi:MAG: regulatory iron-sulfur-containing complex subunit RicT [Phycisphaerales bacterium]